MYARFALIITAAMLAAAALAPVAQAASSTLPVELAPGEEVVSHTTTSEKGSQYVVDLLSSIKGVKIGADRTTVLVNDGDTTHPIEIDYGNALSGSTGAQPGGSSATGARRAGDSGDASRGLGLGQIAGLLLGLTIISRVIAIVRQLGSGRH